MTEFRNFKIEDLFVELSGKHFSKADISKSGTTALVSSDTTNNGIIGYLDAEPSFKISKNTPFYLVFGDHTRAMDILEQDFCITDNVKVLLSKAPSIESLLYVITVWRKAIPSLGYARHWSVAKKVTLSLPAKETSTISSKLSTINSTRSCVPDWDYMAERVAELEAERVAELEAYLQETGLSDCTLTDEDLEVLARKPEMREFRIGDLFDVVGGDTLTKLDMIQGKIPYISSSGKNNGLAAYIGNNEHIHDGNVLTICQTGTVGEVFYQPDSFWASSNIDVAIPKFEMNENLGMYFAAVIRKVGKRYGYSNVFSIGKIVNEKIWLPIKETSTISSELLTINCNPLDCVDFDYIDAYITAIKKKSIAGVIAYKDSVIAETRKIITT